MAEKEYRQNAAECIQLANEATNADARAKLVAMAESWQALAEQAVKNRRTDLVYETPPKKR